MGFKVGVSRRTITPRSKVELAGLGYYLSRTWKRVRDDLTATALVISDDAERSVAIVTLDLMYGSVSLTEAIRNGITKQTGIPRDAVCIHSSHTHNAPTATTLRGAGEANRLYLEFVANTASDAVLEAYEGRQPAVLSTGWTFLNEFTMNRARPEGPLDTRLNVLMASKHSGIPIAVIANFHAHPCVLMALDLYAVSRDVPGEVVDQIETTFPGARALYFQGTCGDVNFKEKYSLAAHCHEPASAIKAAVIEALANKRPVVESGVTAVSQTISLPTRRWTLEEISADESEGSYRLCTGDIINWTEGIARTMVVDPLRLPTRYDGSVAKTVAAISRFAIEWTKDMRQKLDSHPTEVQAEVQAIRIGDIHLAAHPAELFSSLGLELRRRWGRDDLFFLGYSNGGIGYIPDQEDIARRSYAAITSPKTRGEFPFTEHAGRVLIDGLIEALKRTESSPLSRL